MRAIFTAAAFLCASLFAAPAAAAAPNAVDPNAASAPQGLEQAVDGGKTPSHAVASSRECVTYYSSVSRDEMALATGTVVVGYDVTETGAITNVALKQSSGSDRLDNAVLSCIEESWHNTPAMVDGKPVASPGHEARITFNRH